MGDIMRRALGCSSTKNDPLHETHTQQLSESVRSTTFRENSSYQPSYASHQNPTADSSEDSVSKNGTKSARTEAQENHGQESIGWFAKILVDWWILEIASFSLSCGLLTSLIFVLAECDGRPLSKCNFLPGGIGLNSFVALCTEITKIGLVYPVINSIGQLKWIWMTRRNATLAEFAAFDEATRGPWGAVRLLAMLKFWHAASIGVIISLLALGASPVTQQTVAYPNYLVPSDASFVAQAAQVPTSNFWAGTSPEGLESLSPYMKLAVYSALLTPPADKIPEISATCPSGNCTWSTMYDSLAVCSKVTDVTEMLTPTKEFVNNAWEDEYIPAVILPNGAYLIWAHGYIFNITTNIALDLLTDSANIGLVISNTYFIFRTDGKAVVKNPVFNAFELIFYWCINTYETSVQQGISSTIIKSSSVKYNRTMSQNLASEDIFQLNRNISMTATRGNGICNVTADAHVKLQKFVEDVFQGEVDATGANSDVASVLGPALLSDPHTSILNYTKNVATSLTNAVRTHIGSSDEVKSNYIDGIVNDVVTFVEVRWAWLSLIIGLVSAAILFVIFTMISTRISGVEIMKSNPLAAMTILSPEAMNFMGPTALQHGTVKRAKWLKLRLSKGELGWSLDPVE